jgi:moderate conductance mechanosensitive channel
MQADDRFGPLILEPLEVLGVEALSDWSVQLKMRIKTVPLKQWEIGRELRKRILQRFATAGIQLPSPRFGPQPRPRPAESQKP